MMIINKEKYVKSLMICVLSSLCFQTRAVIHLSMVLKSTQVVYIDLFQQHKFIVCYVSVHNNTLDLTKNYRMILIKGKTIQEEEFCSGKCNLVTWYSLPNVYKVVDNLCRIMPLQTC